MYVGGLEAGGLEAMQVDWKHVLVASLFVAGLHAFGNMPLW